MIHKKMNMMRDKSIMLGQSRGGQVRNTFLITQKREIFIFG